MQEKATTVLDALGLVLIAAGIGGGVSPFLGWWSVSVTGAIVMVGSATAAWLARRPGKASP